MYWIQALVSKRFRLGIVCIAIMLGYMPSALYAEDTSGTLSLSPSTGTYVVGSTFTLAIHEDSSTTAVNAVQTDLTYNPSQLEFIGIDSNSSAFNITALEAGGGGKISLARAKLHAPLTGKQLVGSITFKVLGTSGTTAIAFLPTSKILSETTNQSIWNGNTTGTSYSFTATGQVTNSTSHVTSLKTDNLIAVRVFNNTSQSVEGAKVAIDGTTEPTDRTGVASFYNVSPGQHALVVTVDNHTKASTVEVTNHPQGKVQEFRIQLAASKNSSDGLWYIALLLLILIFGIIWGFKKNHTSSLDHTKHHKEV